TRIVHPAYVGVPAQEFGHGQRVVRMAFHAERQSFETLQEQERVERAQGRAEITQTFDPRFHDEREITECLEEADAVVTLAGFEQLRKRAAVPRERAAIHHDAADGGAVTADEFRSGMQNDVRAMLDGPDIVLHSATKF